MIKRFISSVLSKPALFNVIRKIIAGDQENTKQFVKKTLQSYKVKTVLDVGCGTGDFSQAVPKAALYTGVDINASFIAFAKKNFSSKHHVFLRQDVRNKKFYNHKRFDGVMLISMMHHLSNEELQQLLPIVKKITKKTVLVADIIPNPPGILRKLMVSLDQGKYIRPQKEKIAILKKYFKIVDKEIVYSRLAVQYCIVCEV